jgi:MoxR-like ATPase
VFLASKELAMRARVLNGRWILEDPTDLPEGTVVEIVTSAAMPTAFAAATTSVYLDGRLREYIHALFVAACSPKYSAANAGANPSDEEELVARAKSCASRANRSFVTPADIKLAAVESLRRVVVPRDEHRTQGVTPDQIVRAILDEVSVP